MTHSGRIERYRPNSKLDPLNQAAFALHQAYRSALRHDNMPEDTKFAVFSKGNPFVQFIDAAKRELWARQAEYQAGGYTGLRINSGGRAE